MGQIYLPPHALPHPWIATGDRVASKTTPYWLTWTASRSLALHALLVAIVLVAGRFASPSQTLFFGGILTAPLFFFFVWLEGKRTLLKVTPISVYFVWQGFALGPAAVYASMQIESGMPTHVGRHLALPEYLAQGYEIGLLGTLFLHAGMQWLRPAAELKRTIDPTPHQVKGMLPPMLALFCLGCGSLAFGHHFAFLGVVLGFFEFGAHAALICLTLIPLPRLGITEMARAAVLLLGTAILSLASTQLNSKLYLMFSLIGILFYVLQMKKLRRHLPAAAAILIFIYFSVVAPSVSQARLIKGKDPMPYSDALAEAFKLYSPLYTGRFDPAFYQGQLETLLRRQFEVSSIAVIAEEVDLKGHINGETFHQIRYVFVPRLFWPDKPTVVRGGWFTSYLGMSPNEGASTTSIGMEAAGELYWNFGYSGVVIGMFALGSMFGGIWRMAGSNPAFEPLRMALYLLNALMMMNMPEAGSRMASCVAIFVFFGVVLGLLRRRRHSSIQVFRRLESPRPV